MNDQFIPEGYIAPATGGGFAKIEAGENKFRILSSPLPMWVLWSDKNPKRVPYTSEKPAMPTGINPTVKHAWALVVWSYKDSAIQILELTQATLRDPLTAYSQNESWGHPKKYDVIFTKTGSGKDGTKYSFTAIPPAPVSQDILDAYLQNPVDLTQLFVDNGNPFISNSSPAANATPPASTPPPPANPAPPASNGMPFDSVARPEGKMF